MMVEVDFLLVCGLGIGTLKAWIGFPVIGLHRQGK
jgi:hypothetical protein